jgi:hypothetical protein
LTGLLRDSGLGSCFPEQPPRLGCPDCLSRSGEAVPASSAPLLCRCQGEMHGTVPFLPACLMSPAALQELESSAARDAQQVARESAAMLDELRRWRESEEGALWQEERGRCALLCAALCCTLRFATRARHCGSSLQQRLQAAAGFTLDEQRGWPPAQS